MDWMFFWGQDKSELCKVYIALFWFAWLSDSEIMRLGFVIQLLFCFSSHVTIIFSFRILGIDVRFTDKRARLDLLNFALCYCPVEEIKIILNERRVIEVQVYYSCSAVSVEWSKDISWYLFFCMEVFTAYCSTIVLN